MSDRLSAAQLAIRAIDKRPILYTDSIKGNQTCRDDLWAITTAERDAIIAALNTAQPPAAQPVAWIYEWGCGGSTHLALSPASWNGRYPDGSFPVYRQPDPRIAVLEGLLREAHENLREWMFQLDDNASHDSTQFSFCRGCGIVEYRDHRKDCSANALVERIEAALKEG